MDKLSMGKFLNQQSILVGLVSLLGECTFIMAHAQMEINGLMKTPNLFRQLDKRNQCKTVQTVQIDTIHAHHGISHRCKCFSDYIYRLRDCQLLMRLIY